MAILGRWACLAGSGPVSPFDKLRMRLGWVGPPNRCPHLSLSKGEGRLARLELGLAELFEGGDFGIAQALAVEEHAAVLLHVHPANADIGLE
jgi:hypothetical protein